MFIWGEERVIFRVRATARTWNLSVVSSQREHGFIRASVQAVNEAVVCTRLQHTSHITPGQSSHSTSRTAQFLTRKWHGEKWSQQTRSTCPLKRQIRWPSFGLRQSYRTADLWHTTLWLVRLIRAAIWLVKSYTSDIMTYLSYDPLMRVWASNGWNFSVWTCDGW